MLHPKKGAIINTIIVIAMTIAAAIGGALLGLSIGEKGPLDIIWWLL